MTEATEEKIFDISSLATIEEEYMNEGLKKGKEFGYKKGFEQGRIHGERYGKALGNEMGRMMGYCQGISLEQVEKHKRERLQTQRDNLINLINDFKENIDPKDEELLNKIQKIRLKFNIYAQRVEKETQISIKIHQTTEGMDQEETLDF